MLRRTLTGLMSLVLVVAVAAVHAEDDVPNGSVHEGTEVSIDIPVSQRQKNTGGSDGAGLCVFASLQMAAWWETIPELDNLFEYMKTQPGGGWPEKVDRILKERAPTVPYAQYVGDDPKFLRACLRIGRPPSVTYGYGKLYGNQTIAHMVLLVHLDDKRAAILDNNDPEHVTWMSSEEFLKRWVHPSGEGWAVCLLAPPPPPIPFVR